MTEFNDSQILMQLLKDKEALMSEAEKLTFDISLASIDEIGPLLEKRGAVLESVIKKDSEIKVLIGGNEHMRAVINCSCDIPSLDDGEKELFEEAIRIKAIANRIIKNEETIRLKIENERDTLLKNIETLNHSSKVVAESYKRSVETGISRGFRKNDKSI